MADHRMPVIEMKQEIFCPPFEMGNRSPLESGGKIFRQRTAQIATPDRDPRQATALKDRDQTAADGFDFGKFGHDSLS
jgi:hypothetical protein